MNKSLEKLAIVVVTYNQYLTIRNFLINHKNIIGNFNKPYLLVLDNNSVDNTYELIKKEFPELDIRKLEDNFGCVKARNIGIKETLKLGFEYIGFLDNDVIVRDLNFYEKIMEILMDFDVDGISPYVFFEDNVLQFPTKKSVLIKNPLVIKDYNLFKVEYLPGCAQFYKINTFFKYGLFDEDYSPISIEDYEFGKRINKKGGKIVVVKNLKVIHLHNRYIKFSFEKMRYVVIGRTVYLRKNLSLIQLLKEFKYSIYTIFNYGLFNALSWYREGFSKKINTRVLNLDKCEY